MIQFCHGNSDSIRLKLDGFHWFNWEFVRMGKKGGLYGYAMQPLTKDSILPDGLWQKRESGELVLPEKEPRVCSHCGFIFEGLFLIRSRNATTRHLFGIVWESRS